MLIEECNILALDTETTGTDPAADSVVELGGAFFQAGRYAPPPLRTLVNPGRSIPPEASAIHGIRDSDVKTAPRFGQIADRLLARVREANVLAGYNLTGYDGPILNAELARAGAGWTIAPFEALDPLIWIRWKMRDWPSKKLGAVCARFEIPLGDAAHTAAADARAAGELLLVMVRRGDIPRDLVTALAWQGAAARLLADERERWGYHLYRGRDDSPGAPSATGPIRIGFGKHIGKALADVPAEYFRFILGRFPDIPQAAREEMQAHAARSAA